MIDIINGWYYEYDGTQYILYHEVEREIRNVKTKETRIGTVRETIGYFSSLSTILAALEYPSLILRWSIETEQDPVSSTVSTA